MDRLKPLRVWLCGRSIRVREAIVADASFIVALRGNPLHSKFIHPRLPSVMVQEDWLVE